MAYATREELTSLSLPSGALAGVTTAKQDAALEAASRLADGYLNARYRLPLTAYGSDLKKAVCDIAALMIIRARGFNPEQADGDLLVSGHRDAIKWLEGVAAGKISPLGIEDGSTGGQNTGDLADAQRGPFVVQLREDNPERDEFWQGTTAGGGGGVGTPKRRGW